MEAKYQYLRFFPYASIQNWSVQYMMGNDFGYSDKYPLVRIGSFLKKNKTAIDILDDVEYKQVTVRTNNGGVCLRDIKKGVKIGTKKQNIVRKGQYIVSKIDARNGAFGIIPEELDGAIVTNDFPVFDVEGSIINSDFLLLVTTTKQFVAFAQSCSSGTTNRRRIDIDKFLEQKIPLPSIEEQICLMKDYGKKIQQIKEQQIQITDIEEEIDKYFYQKLCVDINISSLQDIKDCKYLKEIHSKNVQRWDCYHVKMKSVSTKYNNSTLSDILTGAPMYGAAYKATNTFSGIRYIRITDINEDGTLIENPISAQEYSEHYLLKQNDFLIARSGNTVGKTFLYDEKFGKAIFAGYLIKFCINEELVNPKYLLFYTKSQLYKKWIASNMRVSAQPNINSLQYLKSPIILPPISVQNEIVHNVQKKYADIMELKKNIQRLKAQALYVFENTLFKLVDNSK